MLDPRSAQALYAALFARGLGLLPMLRHKDGEALFGFLTMDKAALVFRDHGLFKNIDAAQVAPCWDLGIIGAVAEIEGREWDSLSFLGPDHCRIPADLSSTRTRVPGRFAAGAGENVLGFYGSVYRGFKLMLDSSLLPVVLPYPIETRKDVIGLAVTDFRYANVPMSLLVAVNDIVRTAVERQLTLSVEEINMDEQEFDQLFARFKR